MSIIFKEEPVRHTCFCYADTQLPGILTVLHFIFFRYTTVFLLNFVIKKWQERYSDDISPHIPFPVEMLVCF